MRLVRLNYNKVKVFLTLDDLSERGLTKEDVWKDSMKWHQLFHDMLQEVNEEFGVEIQGSVAVEIFSMHAQGMIMIVTIEEQEEEDVFHDGFIEMQVIMEEREEVLFEFDDFENIILLAKHLSNMNMNEGSLYAYHNRYYFYLSEITTVEADKYAAVFAEYGNPSMLSVSVLKEYGKEVIKKEAVAELLQYFS